MELLNGSGGVRRSHLGLQTISAHADDFLARISTRAMSKEQATNIILDSIADGVFTVDKDWRITSFNRAAQEITGVPRDEAIGKPC